MRRVFINLFKTNDINVTLEHVRSRHALSYTVNWLPNVLTNWSPVIVYNFKLYTQSLLIYI